MNINKLMVGAMTASLGLFAYGSLPQVSNVTMTQDLGRNVTITYNLDTAAVVTLDVQTNANTSASADDPGWTSIGGVAVCNAKGDVWKKVEAGDHTITWRPDLSWPGNVIADGGARAVVTAWALNNTPDYMVVDISDGAQPNTQRYYPAVDFLPGSALGQTGAVTNNPAYKTTMIVMRKIMAKGVTWTMGSTLFEKKRLPNESTHQVTLTNNYYIGIFPVTQVQWALSGCRNNTPAYFTNEVGRAMRPIENVCFNNIRMANFSANADANAQEWPGAPFSGSVLDRFRVKTGIDFDLPSEAQWEFAARAGNGSTCWGNGTYIMDSDTNDENLFQLGRCMHNGGRIDTSPQTNAGPEHGTAIVGSFNPNDWGIYDMHGNVWEWCLDWFTDDVSELNGAVNVTATSKRVVRGGAWNQTVSMCRPAARQGFEPNVTWEGYGTVGLRLACRAGLD